MPNMLETKETFAQLPMDAIEPDPDQHRREFEAPTQSNGSPDPE